MQILLNLLGRSKNRKAVPSLVRLSGYALIVCIIQSIAINACLSLH